jgi:oligosaccharide repeat unit polymerase
VALIFLVASLIVASGTIFSKIRGNRAFGDLSRRLGININLEEPSRSVVVEIYGYFALPFENLSNFVNSYSGGWHPGIGLLRPVYSLFQLGSIPKQELDQIDFPLLILPINTSPFITVNYAEFGWLGVFIAPILYASLVNAVYVNFRNKPTLVALMAYAAVPIGWLWIATNAEFTGIRFYFYLLFPALVMVVYNSLGAARRTVRAPHGAA